MNDIPQALTLADWQALYDNRDALIKSPEAYQYVLDELASALHSKGVIDAGELADLIEQAEAAYQSGVEEQLSAELNHPDVN
jgi:hypothetical protein